MLTQMSDVSKTGIIHQRKHVRRNRLLRAVCERMESRLLMTGDLPPIATFAAAAVSEGQVATVVFSDVADPTPGNEGTTFTFSYDFNNDGIFDVIDSPDAAATVPADLTLEGPATLTVAGRVTASTGLFSDFSTSLGVNNAAPTLDATVIAPVYENGSARIRFANISDSSGDLNAKLTFSLVNPSTFSQFTPYWNATTVGSVTTIDAGVTIRVSDFADGPATTSVTIRATDRDGAFTDVVVPIEVIDLPPTIVLQPVTGSNVINQFGTFALKITSSDASGDAITSYLIDWGDGSDPQTVLPASAANVPHAYNASGQYSISVTATNDDGSFTRSNLIAATNDTTYGTNGVVVPILGASAIATAVGADGSVFFLSPNSGNYTNPFQVQKFRPDGQLDLSFGQSGVAMLPSSVGVTLNQTYPPYTGPSTVLQVDDSGRLHIATLEAPYSFLTRMVIYRLTATGQLDSSFNGTGKVQAPISSAEFYSNFLLRKMMILDDGSVVGLLQNQSAPPDSVNVPYYVSPKYNLILWWNSDGTPRSGFTNVTGVSGVAAIPHLAKAMSYVHDLVPNDDGGFTVVGTRWIRPDNVNYPLQLLRVSPSGAIDTSFGNAGISTYEPLSVSIPSNTFSAMVRQSDGKLVAVFSTLQSNFFNYDLLVTRFNIDGSIDATFGSNGFTRIDAAASSDVYPSLQLAADDSILLGFNGGAVASYIYDALVLARLTSDGALDPTFGSDGVIIRSDIRARIALTVVSNLPNRVLVANGTSAYAINPSGNIVDVRNKLYGSTLTSPLSAQENQPATFTVNPPAGLPANELALLRYSLDFENDGTFDVIDSTSPSLTIPAYAFDSTSNLTVRARVTDETGAFVDLLKTIIYYNTAPTATIVMPASVPEGSSVPIGVTGIVDSAADIAAGFTYCLDPSNYTPNSDVYVPLDQLQIPAAALRFGPSTYNFKVRMKDKDGATTDLNGSVNVTNLPPSVGSFTANTSFVKFGESIQFTVTGLSDPGKSDLHIKVYRDNGDNLSDPVTDTLVADYNIYSYAYPPTGISTLSSAFWGLPLGTQRLYARVVDYGGLDAISNAVTVSILPATIASLSSTPDLVNLGGAFTLNANSVQAATGATVSKVEFYRDLNGNGIIDPGVDRLQGTDTSSASGWNYKVTTSASWPIGPQTFMARALDSVSGLWSNTASTIVTLNSPPTVNSLTALPAASVPEGPITLTAASVTDVDGTISAVEIYFDSNNNSKIEPSTDAKLTVTVDNSGTTPRYLASTIAPASVGTYRFLARAQDNRGAWGATKTLTYYVSLAPHIDGAFTATPNPVPKGQTLNLAVDNVVDDDGTVSSVSFYRDVDGDGQVGVLDKLLGSDASPADGFTLGISSTSTSLITGINNLLAVAKDNRGVSSLPKLTSVLIDAPPTLSSFSSSSAPKASAPITLAALGSSDITAVAFYKDNGDSLFNASTDTLLGYGTFDSVSLKWRLILPANTLPSGTVRVWAQAFDGVSYSAARMLKLTVAA